MLDELQRQLEKLTNQARFIKMIVDGDLVVSKKKKAVLIAELRKLNFRAFPKLDDAKKSGEQEAVVDPDEEEDPEDAQSGANDYDYLLGVSFPPPIVSGLDTDRA